MGNYDFGGLTELLSRIEKLAYNPATAAQAEQLAAAMLTVLGSGPSMAAIQEIIATSDPTGIIYANAQHQQQMTNILGMVATMQAVQTLLNAPLSAIDLDAMGDLPPHH